MDTASASARHAPRYAESAVHASRLGGGIHDLTFILLLIVTLIAVGVALPVAGSLLMASGRWIYIIIVTCMANGLILIALVLLALFQAPAMAAAFKAELTRLYEEEGH